jgi:hypothetical protein
MGETITGRGLFEKCGHLALPAAPWRAKARQGALGGILLGMLRRHSAVAIALFLSRITPHDLALRDDMTFHRCIQLAPFCAKW